MPDHMPRAMLTDGGNADAPKCADVCGDGQDDTRLSKNAMDLACALRTNHQQHAISSHKKAVATAKDATTQRHEGGFLRERRLR